MINLHKHKKAATLRRLWNAMNLYSRIYEQGEKQSGLWYLDIAESF